MIIEFAKYKTFKAPTRKPVKGDWIICNNTLGKIIDYDEWFKYYDVKLFYKQYNSRSYLNITQISHFGTKDEMDAIITANKYNL